VDAIMATGSYSAPPTTSPAQAERERYIEGQLNKTRRQVKLVELGAAAVTLLVGLLAFFFVVAIIDHWVVALGTVGRTLALVALLAGVAWYVWAVILPLLRNSINPAYAALTIEHSTPTLKNSLINLLMLRAHRGEVHEVVYEAVEARAESDLRQVPVDSVVDYSRLIHIGYVLAGIFAICAAYKILSPKDPLQTVARVAAPWADIARPSRVKISGLEPGDVEKFFGDRVTIAAQIRGARTTDNVELVVSTLDGQTRERRIPLTPDDQGLTFATEYPPDGQGLQQDLMYRIEAGDAVTRDYRVTVVASPTIAVEQLTYDFPRYTQRPQQVLERVGDVRALEGTRVTVTARANQPIHAAQLEFDPTTVDGSPEATLRRERVPLEVDGNVATGSFVLELEADRATPKHQTYHITFVTESGYPGRQPALHTIDVIRDLPPEVEVLQPSAQEVDVPENGTALVEVRALDADFGLSRVSLKLTQDGNPLAEPALLDAPGGQPGQSVTKYYFRPAAHKLKAGDQVAWHAAAYDNRVAPKTNIPEPNSARTKNYFFRVVAADKNIDKNKNDQPNAGEQQDQDPQPGDKGQEDKNQGPDPNAEKQPADGGAGDKEEGEKSKDMNNGKSGEQDENQSPDGQGDMGTEKSDKNDKSQDGGEQGQNEKPMPGAEAGDQSQPGNAPGADTPSDQPMPGQASDANKADGNSGGAGEAPKSEQGGAQGDPSSGDKSDGNKSGGNEGAGNDAKANGQDGGSGAGEDLHEGEAFEKALEHLLKQAQENKQSEQNSGEAADTPDLDKLPPDLQARVEKFLKEQAEKQRGQEQSGDAPQNQAQGGGEPLKDSAKQGERGGEAPQEQGTSQGGERPDKKQGDGQGDPMSQGAAGQPEGGEKVKPEQGREAGDATEGERQGGLGQNGDSGAGRGSKDKSGAAADQEANQDKLKHKQPGDMPPSEGGEAQSPSNSKRQSDSEGGSSGDRSGGGEKGPGQSAGAAGNDAAGSNSAADQGAGAANQAGKGETGENAGQQQTADRATGEPGTAEGSGSTSQDDPSGDQPGGARAQNPSGGETVPSDPNRPPQPGQSSDDNRGGQRNDLVTGGGQPYDQSASHPYEGDAPAAEAAKIDYAQRATDLVIDYLKDQKDQPSKELLDDLNWSKEDLQRFLSRWEEAKRAAAQDENAKRELNEALRSLGLRPQADVLRRGQAKSDNVRGLGDVGPSSAPPTKYLDQFRAFKKGAARAK
jgi:hypothetical protein